MTLDGCKCGFRSISGDSLGPALGISSVELGRASLEISIGDVVFTSVGVADCTDAGTSTGNEL